MSGWCRAPVWPISGPRRNLCRQGPLRRSIACARFNRSTSAIWTSCRAESARGTARLYVRACEAVRGAKQSLLRRNAVARGDAMPIYLCLQCGRESRRQSDDFTVVITKSTVPVGNRRMKLKSLSAMPVRTRILPSCRIRNSSRRSAIQDSNIPTYLVGTDDPARKPSWQTLPALYLNAAPILYVNRRTAELVNMRQCVSATKITFNHEIADFVRESRSEVQDVARARGSQSHWLEVPHAGPGSVARVSPRMRLRSSRRARQRSAVAYVETVAAVTTPKARHGRKVMTALRRSVRGKRLRCWAHLQTEHGRHAGSAIDPLITALQDMVHGARL